MVNNNIINLVNPTSNQEAATKNYVNNVLNGPNLFISTNARNTSLAGIYNTGLGTIALKNLTSGTANTIIGYAAVSNINAGQNNVGVSYNSLALCTTGHLAQKKRDQSLATVRDSQHLYAQQQHIVAH